MQRRVIWRTRDGLIHRATIVDVIDVGLVVRSDCGRTGHPAEGDLPSETPEVTCPNCRRTTGMDGTPTAGAESGNGNANPLRLPEKRPSDEPKLLGEILHEMKLAERSPERASANGTRTEGWALIHRYTRADALRDGVLLDVTATAKKAGIKYPTAVTSAVWANFVRVPEGVVGQDEQGRLWDILWLLRQTIRRCPGNPTTVHFHLHVRNDPYRVKRHLLKAVCGPDDDSSPCITVMLPDED